MTDRQDWHDRIVGALGAVLAVAIVIGGVVGVVTYAAARITGLTGGDSAAQPSTASTTSAAPSPSAADTASATATPSPTTSPTETQTHHETHHRSHHRPAEHDLTLSASPQHVGPMGRIDLYGRYPGHDGATLAVERREGGHWSRFPVSATVRGGRFHTWVASGQSGSNAFRVVDEGSGRRSDPVTVSVG